MTSLIQRAKVIATNDFEALPTTSANVTSSFVMDGQGFDEYDVPVHASEADEEFERLERDLQRLNSHQHQQQEWNYHQRDSTQQFQSQSNAEEALPSETASAIYHQPQMNLSEPERQLAELVQSKVAALNAQIERYTTEMNKLSESSSALANERAKLDEEAKALSKEKHEFKAWRDSEHSRFETWRNELTAKMDKERRVAVRQARASAAAMNALPDRQERAELENLKKELIKVKADLSASEAKYKSAVDRHRAGAAVSKDQIAQLEAQIRKYEEERIAVVFGPNAISTHSQQTSTNSAPSLALSNVASIEAKKIKKQQQNGTNSSLLISRTAPVVAAAAPPPPPPPPSSVPVAAVSPIDTEQQESDIWSDYNRTKTHIGSDLVEADNKGYEDGQDIVEENKSAVSEQMAASSADSKGVIEDEYMDALLGRTVALRNSHSSSAKAPPALTPAGISGNIVYNPARYSSSSSSLAKVAVEAPLSSTTTIFAPPAPTRLSGAPNAHVKEIPTEMHMLGSSSSTLSTSTVEKSAKTPAAGTSSRTPSTALRLPAMQPLSALMGSQSDAPSLELDKKTAPQAHAHIQGAPISRSLRAHLESRISPRELGLGVVESGRVALVQQTEVEGPSGKTEMRFADGSRVVRFRNGTEKEQRPGGVSIVRFNNGDIKRSVPRDVTEGGGVVDSYFYASAGTLQTTYPHGIDVYEFPNGQIELHDSIASLKEILFNDGSVRSVHLNAGETSHGSQMIPTNMMSY